MLNPNTKLHRSPNLQIQLSSPDTVEIMRGATVVNGGPHALAILHIFARPTTLRDALDSLAQGVRGSQDWINLTTALSYLYQTGILEDDSRDQRPLLDTTGFGAAPIHLEMLNDRQRTSCFLAAIAEVVRPGDVVVDIGTGTGVLAIAAVRAGAKRVYAIESTAMASVAAAIIAANGCSEQITLISGWSTQVELPERGDVLTSEIIGNDPLGEQVLETTADARQRLLKLNPRLLPQQLAIYALPLTLPPDEWARRVVTSETLDNWRSWYGMDFAELAAAQSASATVFYLPPHRTQTWPVLSDPILLAKIDLNQAERYLNCTSTAFATTSGHLDAILIYFELQLSPTVSLSTRPGQASSDCSWRCPLWLLGHSLFLQAQESFQVTYRYGIGRQGNLVQVSRP
ncbi:MAG: hypothetical protein HC890_01470 [Chloroflexaceae bacterium]|nr:hypothetical protein [Chloroflexaceae bacterium]